jgi:hypothetical protein
MGIQAAQSLLFNCTCYSEPTCTNPDLVTVDSFKQLYLSQRLFQKTD